MTKEKIDHIQNQIEELENNINNAKARIEAYIACRKADIPSHMTREQYIKTVHWVEYAKGDLSNLRFALKNLKREEFKKEQEESRLKRARIAEENNKRKMERRREFERLFVDISKDTLSEEVFEDIKERALAISRSGK